MVYLRGSDYTAHRPGGTDALLTNMNEPNMSHLLVIIIALCLQVYWIRE